VIPAIRYQNVIIFIRTYSSRSLELSSFRTLGSKAKKKLALKMVDFHINVDNVLMISG